MIHCFAFVITVNIIEIDLPDAYLIDAQFLDTGILLDDVKRSRIVLLYFEGFNLVPHCLCKCLGDHRRVSQTIDMLQFRAIRDLTVRFQTWLIWLLKVKKVLLFVETSFEELLADEVVVAGHID